MSMEEKLKYSLLRGELTDNQSIWTRHEKRVWFLTLITGTCMLYSTRTTMPLLVPAVAAEQKWTKTDSGTVLSSFFWGYTLTQVVGGYFSDRFGGQKVILFAAIGWSLITFFMPNIIWWAPEIKTYSIPFIVTVRIINGAFQGVHFPSMISLTSQVPRTAGSTFRSHLSKTTKCRSTTPEGTSQAGPGGLQQQQQQQPLCS